MADYIEREALIDAIEGINWYKYNDEGRLTQGGTSHDKMFLPYSAVEGTVKNFPAADVRPVVMGKWLTGNDNPRTYGRIRAMCGKCGAFALAEMVNAGSYKEQLSNFCPNCGAMMEES